MERASVVDIARQGAVSPDADRDEPNVGKAAAESLAQPTDIPRLSFSGLSPATVIAEAQNHGRAPDALRLDCRHEFAEVVRRRVRVRIGRA
jgi:hypothetical protein